MSLVEWGRPESERKQGRDDKRGKELPMTSRAKPAPETEATCARLLWPPRQGRRRGAPRLPRNPRCRQPQPPHPINEGGPLTSTHRRLASHFLSWCVSKCHLHCQVLLFSEGLLFFKKWYGGRKKTKGRTHPLSLALALSIHNKQINSSLNIRNQKSFIAGARSLNEQDLHDNLT